MECVNCLKKENKAFGVPPNKSLQCFASSEIGVCFKVCSNLRMAYLRLEIRIIARCTYIGE